MLEAEQKFRIQDCAAVIDNLRGLGFVIVKAEQHEDTYLRHPARDFATSGEALRLRCIDGTKVVTYKGPRFAGPVKIRPEIELPIAGELAEWLRMWQLLGFTIAERVRKTRTVMTCSAYPNVSIAVDRVERLGDFVEIETLIEDDADQASAVQTIEGLAKEIGLNVVEPRSYLRQILEQTKPSTV